MFWLPWMMRSNYQKTEEVIYQSNKKMRILWMWLIFFSFTLHHDLHRNLKENFNGSKIWIKNKKNFTAGFEAYWICIRNKKFWILNCLYFQHRFGLRYWFQITLIKRAHYLFTKLSIKFVSTGLNFFVNITFQQHRIDFVYLFK